MSYCGHFLARAMKSSLPTTSGQHHTFLVCDCGTVDIVIPIEYELGDSSDHQPRLVFDINRWHIKLPRKEHTEV